MVVPFRADGRANRFQKRSDLRVYLIRILSGCIPYEAVGKIQAGVKNELRLRTGHGHFPHRLTEGGLLIYYAYAHIVG